MATKEERKNKPDDPYANRFTSPIFNSVIHADGTREYAPHLRGWQINVGERRRAAIAAFFADRDKEKMSKTMDEINEYAIAMKKKFPSTDEY